MNDFRWYDLLACAHVTWGLLVGIMAVAVFLNKQPLGNLYVYLAIAIIALIAGELLPIRREK